MWSLISNARDFLDSFSTLENIAYLNYYSGGAVRLTGGTNVTSDDRIKHNEADISNALQIINKLNPKKYFKSQKRYDKDYHYQLDNSGLM